MRMKLGLTMLALSMFAASPAFAQDATGTTKESETPAAPQAAPADKPMRVRIGGRVAAANITHMVQPVYPQAAKTAGISGTVVLHCIIAKDGTMTQVEYVSGPPLLMKAAMDAVRQWTYKPTTLNGQVIEVDTTVSVVFQLGKKSSGDSKPDTDGLAPDGGADGSSVASTGNTVNPVPAPIDPQLKADILHLMEVTHFKEKEDGLMRSLFDSMRPSMLAGMPNTPNREKILSTYIDKLVELLHSENFTSGMTALYAKYLTDADVQAASAFYETPAGQHYLDSAQKLTPEAMTIGQRIASESIPTILKDLCKQYPELEGEAKFCGPADPTKKSLLSGEHAPAGN